MANEPIQIPYKFTPRDYQIPILSAIDEGCKRLVWCLHRRAGKDLTIWNAIIKQALTKKQIIFYFLPTYSQAKKVIWTGMTRDGFSFIDHVPPQLIERKSEAELSLTLKNGSIIQLIGAESYNRIVGTAPSMVVFSEAALISPDAWNYIRPILTENNGTAIFISTPRGLNWFKDLFDMAKHNKDWFCESLTIDDTKAISQEVVQAEIDSGMSEELAQQEFYVSFARGVEGSYYGKLLDVARTQNRVGNVIHDPNATVNTAWDIGMSDSTAILFYQQVAGEIHIIDSYENNGEPLSHYVNVLENKRVENRYIYKDHFLPHDIQVRELSSGISRKDTLIQLGLRIQVLPTLKLSIADGIEATRGLFPRFWIDEYKCAGLLKALENYRKEYDAKNNVYSDRPVHNFASHMADSLRYLSLACKLSTSSTMSLSTDELYRRNRENRRRI